VITVEADPTPAPAAQAIEEAPAVNRSTLRELAYWAAWMLSFVGVVVVVGGQLGAPIWLLCFLRFAGRLSIRFAVVGAVAAGLVLYLASNFLTFAMPERLFLG
jgi:hypothetical protein